jgi:hypothetical protein
MGRFADNSTPARATGTPIVTASHIDYSASGTPMSPECHLPRVRDTMPGSMPDSVPDSAPSSRPTSHMDLESHHSSPACLPASGASRARDRAAADSSAPQVSDSTSHRTPSVSSVNKQ